MTENSATLILCIDDDPDTLNLLQYLLKRGSFEVITADSGRQGIRLATAKKPDVILLDIEMPGMNGYEVCLELQRDPLTSFIPVVFLTVHKAGEDRRRAFAAGAADFMTKPFQLEPLLEKIRRQLVRKTNWDQLRDKPAPLASPSASFFEFKKALSKKLDFSPSRHGQWMEIAPLQLYYRALDFDLGHEELARHIADYVGAAYLGQSIGTVAVRLGVLPAAFSKEHHIIAVDPSSCGVSFILSNPFDLPAVDAMKKIGGAEPAYGVAEPSALATVFRQAGKTATGAPGPAGGQPAASAGRSSTPSILIVDDDAEALTLLHRHLIPEGYRVTTASDGMDALLKLGQKHFDLVISDVCMPSFNGLKLLSLFKEKQLDIPVLLVTAYTDKENEIKGLMLGAEDYLQKPLDKSVLLLKVKKALGRHTHRR